MLPSRTAGESLRRTMQRCRPATPATPQGHEMLKSRLTATAKLQKRDQSILTEVWGHPLTAPRLYKMQCNFSPSRNLQWTQHKKLAWGRPHWPRIWTNFSKKPKLSFKVFYIKILLIIKLCESCQCLLPAPRLEPQRPASTCCTDVISSICEAHH